MIKIHDILTRLNLYKAALRMSNVVAYNRNRGFVRSYDGMTYWEFAQKIDSIIERVLKSHTYAFSPMLLIQKRVKTKTRKIYISTWQDRLVESLLNCEINKKLNNYFSKRSYAYRPDKVGINQCQFNLSKAMNNIKYIARRDISNYFYTIDHNILLGKLAPLVDQDLYALLAQRIRFEYYGDGLSLNNIGIPFGSSVAGILANIYLTDLDKQMQLHTIKYFRYADDIIIGGDDESKVLQAVNQFDEGIRQLKLELNPKKCYYSDILKDKTPIKFLGLEFRGDVVRLPIEKRRKIINFFKYALQNGQRYIKKQKSIEGKTKCAVQLCNDVIENRIRSVAIIDYYLNHINDEDQLKCIDRQISQMVISYILNKKFRPRDYKLVSYKSLRKCGLQSLLHRSRLIKQGHIKIPFMSLYNKLMLRRYEQKMLSKKYLSAD